MAVALTNGAFVLYIKPRTRRGEDRTILQASSTHPISILSSIKCASGINPKSNIQVVLRDTQSILGPRSFMYAPSPLALSIFC